MEGKLSKFFYCNSPPH